MTSQEKEAMREMLIAVDTLLPQAQNRLNKIYDRTVNLHRPFSIPKLRKDIQEIQTVLSSVAHKKKALFGVLKAQEEKQDETSN